MRNRLLLIPLLALLLLPLVPAIPAQKVVELTIAPPKWWSAYRYYKSIWIPYFEGKMAEKGVLVRVRIIDYPAPDPAFIDKTLLDLKAGVAPDVIWVDSFYVGQWAEAGYLYKLTDFVKKWSGWKEYYEPLKSAVTWKGDVYAVMIETDIRPLYYRKDVFKAAGLPVPWHPKSWDDILHAARVIKAESKEIMAKLGLKRLYPIAIKMGKKIEEATTMQGFLMLLAGTGDWIYDEKAGKWVASSPALLDTFKFLEIIYKEGLAVPADVWFGADPIETVHSMLSKGEVAIFPTWQGVWYDMGNPGHRWYIPNRDEVLGYTAMPGRRKFLGKEYPNDPEIVTVSGGWTLAISWNCKHPDLAWEFIKAVLSKELAINRLIVFPGGLPPRKDVAEDPIYKARTDPYTLWAIGLLKYTRFRPSRAEYPDVSTAIQEATELILAGKSAQEVADWYASRIKEIAGPGGYIERG